MAEIVRAVVAKRGRTIRNNARLWDFVTTLSEEYPHWRLLQASSIANTLHTNFYEDWLNREAVEADANVVRDFGKLRNLR